LLAIARRRLFQLLICPLPYGFRHAKTAVVSAGTERFGARTPLIDSELAAYVSALPDQYRQRGGTKKWIFREAVKKSLLAALVASPKAGLSGPDNGSFRGPVREFLYDRLTGSNSGTRACYRRPALDKTPGDHAGGRQKLENLFWRLLCLDIGHLECRLA
jgi:asparagine synthase (glutamine-hydrolysing)